jgi:chemosensory pili system protein ChpA (sensor histidine kinase/response regulator)
MSRKVDREVLVGFIEEAKSYLPAIFAGIDTFKKDTNQIDGLEVAHRHVHTIKGASSMVGLAGLSHIAYQVEAVLEEIGAGNIEMGETAVLFLHKALDAIETYLDGVLSGNVQEQSLVTAVTLAQRRLRGLPEDDDDLAIAATLAQIEPTPPLPAAKPADRPVPIPAPVEPVQDDISPELLDAFLVEAEDHLQHIGRQLASLDKDPSQTELLQEVRRAIHTIKGGAGTVGFHSVSRLAHRMEDLLDQLYDGQFDFTPDIITCLFDSADLLEGMLFGSGDSGETRARLADLYSQYDGWLGQQEPGPAATAILTPLGEEPTIDLAELAPQLAEAEAKTKTELIAAQPSKAGEVVRVPLERLDELVRSVSELVITRTTFEQHMGSMVRLVDELWHSFERLRQVSHKLETQYEVTALGGGQWTLFGKPVNSGINRDDDQVGQVISNEFDALQMDRYTEFHLLSRELTETTSDLRTIGNELRHLIGDYDGVLNRQGRLSSEIQDKLMRTRMVPLATIATRLYRAVRVVSQKQDKQVDLVIDGEMIELDKKVLEEMADPLLHVLRNAVDHGIEPPALRQVTGKPERGQIQLKAYYQGNQVVLEVRDDGAGLEPQLLRAKAINGGYVSEAEAPHLTDDELYSLIFTPGFSTAETISEVSGRGVGLDILRNSVHKLKGTITVTSQSGEGTTFTIRLPMTLAVTRALLVSANQETYAVPLASVSQILRIDRTEFEQVGQDEVVRVAGKVYPLLNLADVLHLPPTSDEPLQRPPILILETGVSQVALVVDEIVEGREIVVKTLGNHLRHIHAITGATLMGDGRIVLILNPAELVASPEQTERRSWTPVGAAAEKSHKPLSVLIVDDSVSVRRVVSNLIKNAGWQPVTAKDGLEALGYIQNAAQLPDVMLLDIEMPRMDGYELAATLQSHQQYQQIPIVMLTSRAGDKHRQKALDLGVAEYMVKPYQDEVLLNIVRRLGQQSRERGATEWKKV